MKAIEQYFHVILFIVLYRVVLTFKSVDQTLVYVQSNTVIERQFEVALFHYVVQGRECG